MYTVCVICVFYKTVVELIYRNALNACSLKFPVTAMHCGKFMAAENFVVKVEVRVITNSGHLSYASTKYL